MRFTEQHPCPCGGTYTFVVYGDGRWTSTVCPACGVPGNNIDPLSVAVTAERLLRRSLEELKGGDYTLTVLIGTMAVESFLTRLFFKFKKMENYATTLTWPTPQKEKEWEDEYGRRTGFLKPADFVSNTLTGMPFDVFVAANAVAGKIMAEFPNAAHLSPKQYIQTELFHRRNYIAHWGYVNTGQAEAELCHKLAVAVVVILREMDKSKYGTM